MVGTLKLFPLVTTICFAGEYMFKLKISNLEGAVQLSQQWATHTVSILDADIDYSSRAIELPLEHNRNLLRRYFFHDIFLEEYTLPNVLQEPIFVTEQHIKDILEFTALLQADNRLLIHCHAGISRSTAVACGVLCQHGLPPQEAVNIVFSLRSQALPNPRVIVLFDKILSLGGQLIAATKGISCELYGNNMEKFYEQLVNLLLLPNNTILRESSI